MTTAQKEIISTMQKILKVTFTTATQVSATDVGSSQFVRALNDYLDSMGTYVGMI